MNFYIFIYIKYRDIYIYIIIYIWILRFGTQKNGNTTQKIYDA
jgi:hypothetical protein